MGCSASKSTEASTEAPSFPWGEAPPAKPGADQSSAVAAPAEATSGGEAGRQQGQKSRAPEEQRPRTSPRPRMSPRPAACAPEPAAADAEASDSPHASRFSSASASKLDSLDEMDADLSGMEATSADAEAVLTGGDSIPRTLRTELATLHGDANKLLANRVDALITAEMSSGREAARAKRKQLVVRAEALIERLEAQIKRLDQLKVALVVRDSGDADGDGGAPADDAREAGGGSGSGTGSDGVKLEAVRLEGRPPRSPATRPHTRSQTSEVL